MPVLRRFRRIVCRLRGGHDWRYGGTGAFTGYIERCKRCPAIQQVPQ